MCSQGNGDEGFNTECNLKMAQIDFLKYQVWGRIKHVSECSCPEQLEEWSSHQPRWGSCRKSRFGEGGRVGMLPQAC